MKRIRIFRSLKFKTLATMLIFFVIPLLVQIIVISGSVNKIISEKVLHATKQSFDNAGLHISDRLQTQFDMIMYYSSSPVVTDIVSRMLYSDLQQRAHMAENIKSQLINNKSGRYNFPIEYMLIDYHGNMMTNYTYTPYANYEDVYKKVTKLTWFENLKNSRISSTEVFTSSGYLDSGKTDKIYMARNIFYGENIGVLVIGVDKELFSRTLLSLKGVGEENLYVFSQENSLQVSAQENNLPISDAKKIYENYKEILSAKKNLIADSRVAGGRIVIMSQNLLIKGAGVELVMFSILPERSIMGDVMHINLINTMVVVLYIIAIVWVLSLLNRTVLNPVLNLRKLMEQVQMGNLKVRATGLPQNELGGLGDGFNVMASEIENYISQIHDNEEEKRRIEISLLQSQIKPHFIRNVLNIIRWIAEINGVESISRSIVAVSNLIEYNFKDTNLFCTLEDEIKYVQQYIFLQKLRYQNKFTDNYDIPPEILSCQILKLSFQPIVENAILHGFAGKEGLGVIKIQGKRENDCLVFEISDNGVGMSLNQLNTILNPPIDDVQTMQTEHIALWNVNSRMKKQFGEAYALSVRSIEGEGTSVILRFPII